MPCPEPWGKAMRRREFIIFVGSVAANWPLAARAQQPEGLRRIGVLMGYPESDSEAQLDLAAFVQELQKLGWVDHRNLRRCGDETVCTGTRRAAARCHSCEHHTHHDCAAATN